MLRARVGLLLKLNTNRAFFHHNVSLSSRHLSQSMASVPNMPGFEWLASTSGVQCFVEGLADLHEYSGCSWFTTIVATSLGLRLVTTLPLAAYQQAITARLSNLKPEMDEIAEELKRETAMAMKMYNLDQKQAMALYRHSLKKQMNALIVRDNCHPFKTTVVAWVQIPLWICMSVALRYIAMLSAGGIYRFSGLQTEGALWFSNLVLPDPYFVIPILMTVLNVVNLEVHRLRMLSLSESEAIPKWTRYLLNFSRGIVIIMLPVAAVSPSAVSLYWLISVSSSLIQNLTLMSPRVRRMFRIPSTTQEIEKPYSAMWNKLRRSFVKK